MMYQIKTNEPETSEKKNLTVYKKPQCIVYCFQIEKFLMVSSIEGGNTQVDEDYPENTWP